MAGKGDKPRPVDYKKWSENYDEIFRKKSLDCDKNCDRVEENEEVIESNKEKD